MGWDSHLSRNSRVQGRAHLGKRCRTPLPDIANSFAATYLPVRTRRQASRRGVSRRARHAWLARHSTIVRVRDNASPSENDVFFQLKFSCWLC